MHSPVRPLLWLCFGLLLAVCPATALAQPQPCAPEDLVAALPSNAAVYPESVILSKKFADHGIRVKCVLLSKMDGMFGGQDGAALYRTDRGDFEVLFLPPAKSFEQLKIMEQRDGKRYSYRFKGPPNP